MANEINIYEPRYLAEVVRTAPRPAHFCVTAFSPS